MKVAFLFLKVRNLEQDQHEATYLVLPCPYTWSIILRLWGPFQMDTSSWLLYSTVSNPGTSSWLLYSIEVDSSSQSTLLCLPSLVIFLCLIVLKSSYFLFFTNFYFVKVIIKKLALLNFTKTSLLKLEENCKNDMWFSFFSLNWWNEKKKKDFPKFFKKRK